MIEQPITLKDLNTNFTDINPIIVFKDLYAYRRKTKTSEFGERVSINPLAFNSTLKKDSEGFYCGDIFFEFTAIGDKTKAVHTENATIKMEEYRSPYPITEDFLTSLFILAFSGIHATPLDFEDFAIQSEYVGMYKRQEKPLYCEECENRFARTQELLDHLAETGHNDSMYEDYPYFEGFSRKG